MSKKSKKLMIAGLNVLSIVAAIGIGGTQSVKWDVSLSQGSGCDVGLVTAGNRCGTISDCGMTTYSTTYSGTAYTCFYGTTDRCVKFIDGKDICVPKFYSISCSDEGCGG